MIIIVSIVHLKLELECYLQDGSFLIRDSIRGDPTQPYTLCLFHGRAIFVLMVRLKANGKYAIGTEKNGEPVFKTMSDLLSFNLTIKHL